MWAPETVGLGFTNFLTWSVFILLSSDVWCKICRPYLSQLFIHYQYKVSSKAVQRCEIITNENSLPLLAQHNYCPWENWQDSICPSLTTCNLLIRSNTRVHTSSFTETVFLVWQKWNSPEESAEKNRSNECNLFTIFLNIANWIIFGEVLPSFIPENIVGTQIHKFHVFQIPNTAVGDQSQMKTHSSVVTIT